MINLGKLLTKILQRLKNSLNLERGSSIPANSNLNNYTTLGNYYVASAAVSATINNTPTAGAGYSLIVYSHYGNLPAQIAISKGMAGDNKSYPCYLRSQYTDSNNALLWTPWTGIAIENPNVPIGTHRAVTMGEAGTTQNIATATITQCISLQLTPGRWAIVGQIYYGTGGTAGTYRGAYLGNSSSSAAYATMQVASPSNGVCVVQVHTTLTLTTTTTVILRGQQGSGSTIPINKSQTFLRAIVVR